MRKLGLVVLLLVLLAVPMHAQDAEITLVPFESDVFGLQGVIPDGWRSAGSGVYQRGNGMMDVATIIVQSAPLDRERLVLTLLPRLGLEELPEVTEVVESEAFVWDVYLFDVEAGGMTISINFAMTDDDGHTHLVLSQALAEEGEALRESVFYPVLESVAPLVEDNMPTDVTYLSEEVAFMSGDLTLAGTLTLPDDDGVHPVVVVMSGSGGQNRDGSIEYAADTMPMFTIKPYLEIADHLTRNGFAVMRYDERGIGASEGDIGTATFTDFVADISAAIDYLVTRDDIDPDHIYVIGHSEGGALAPRVAVENADVDGLILMAGPSVTLYDVMVLQNELLLRAAGADDAYLEEYMPIYTNFLSLMAENTDEEALRAAMFELVTYQMGEEPSDELMDQLLIAYQTPYFDEALTYDPQVYWEQLELPVLAVFGSLDLQVPASQSIPPLEAVLADNDDVTITTIESANHLFQEAETGAFGEYGNLDQHLMPEFLDTITDWLLEQVATN